MDRSPNLARCDANPAPAGHQLRKDDIEAAAYQSNVCS
jgi:hypothetical protein